MFKKIFLVIAFGVATLAGWRSYDAATPQQVKELRNPAPPGSLAPSLSAMSDGRVILSWLEPVDSVLAFRFATWNGTNWTRPNTVLRRTDLQPDSAAPPVIASLRDGSMVAVTRDRRAVHWTAIDFPSVIVHRVRVLPIAICELRYLDVPNLFRRVTAIGCHRS